MHGRKRKPPGGGKDEISSFSSEFRSKQIIEHEECECIRKNDIAGILKSQCRQDNHLVKVMAERVLGVDGDKDQIWLCDAFTPE